MKNILYFVMVMMMAVFLVGCTSGEQKGTTDKEGSTSTNSSNTANEKPVQTEENEEQATIGSDTEQPKNEIKAEENTLTYSSNGQEFSKATTVAESDNQNYKLSLLPDFTLSAEEPGKDVVLYAGDDRVFMRIETVAVTDSNYNDMLQATEGFMRASSSDDTITEDANIVKLAPSTAKNASAFVNNYGEDKTTALLFETDELFVRLTVFDTQTVDLTEAMLKMGTTIVTK